MIKEIIKSVQFSPFGPSTFWPFGPSIFIWTRSLSSRWTVHFYLDSLSAVVDPLSAVEVKVNGPKGQKVDGPKHENWTIFWSFVSNKLFQMGRKVASKNENIYKLNISSLKDKNGNIINTRDRDPRTWSVRDFPVVRVRSSVLVHGSLTRGLYWRIACFESSRPVSISDSITFSSENYPTFYIKNGFRAIISLRTEKDRVLAMFRVNSVGIAIS